jgi:hypothetical protein
MTALLLAAQLVAAQPACPSVQPSPAFVCVNGGWLPPGHPGIPAPAAVPTQLDPDCQNLDPYADGEKAAECARRPLPGASTPVFLIGHVYAYGYMTQQARVLGISQETKGVQVVTFEWLPESLNDGVVAMHTPPSVGGRSVWVYIGRP